MAASPLSTQLECLTLYVSHKTISQAVGAKQMAWESREAERLEHC